MSSDLPEPAEAVTDADEWLRQRFGGARSHPEWRTLVEAFNAGRAAPAAPAGWHPINYMRVQEIATAHGLGYNALSAALRDYIAAAPGAQGDA